MKSFALITFIVACAIGVGSESLIHAYLHSGQPEAQNVGVPDATASPATQSPSKVLSNPAEEKVELLRDFVPMARS